MIFHYIKKNLIELIHDKKLFFYLLIVQGLCCIALIFVYGAFEDYNIMQYESDYNEMYYFSFEEANGGQLLEGIDELIDATDGKAKTIYIYGIYQAERDDGHSLMSVINLEDDHYTATLKGIDNFTTISGRYLTDEELNSDNYVAYVSETLLGQDEISFGEDVWEVVGYDKYYELYQSDPENPDLKAIVPPATLKNQPLEGFMIKTSLLLSEQELFEMEKVLDKYIDAEYTAPSIGVESYFREMTQSVSMVSIIMIGILAAFSTVLVYKYLLKKRTRLIEILRLNGARKSKIRAMYFGEIIVFTAIDAIVSLCLFHLLFLPLLSKWYLYFPDIYYGSTYVKLLVMYLLITIGTSMIALWRPLSKY